VDPTAAELGNSLEINLTMRRTIIRGPGFRILQLPSTIDHFFIERICSEIRGLFFLYVKKKGKLIDDRLYSDQNFMVFTMFRKK